MDDTRTTTIYCGQDEMHIISRNSPLPYRCWIDGVGEVVITASSPSDCISQIEERFGVGRPGEENLFAFQVPDQHNGGGECYRGDASLIAKLQSYSG